MDGSKTFTGRASDVGHDRGLYRGGMTPGSTGDWDDYFAPFERMNHGPVNVIVNAEADWFSADAWVKLVGYLSALITKMPDLEWELDNWAQRSEWTRAQIDVGYALNMQRVSAAFLRVRWMFFRDPSEQLILNDRGGAAHFFPEWNAPGYLFPLRKGFAVGVGPGRHKKPLRWDGSSWSIHIPVADLDDYTAGRLNDSTICGAAKMLYGPDQERFERLRPLLKTIPPSARAASRLDGGGQRLGIPLSERMEDELLLFSLLGGISPGTHVGEERFA